MNKVNKITDCMDLLSVWETLNRTEKSQTLNNVIDTLGSYPKPMKKGDTTQPTNEQLGAYLCLSNARNTCKLALMDFVPLESAYTFISVQIEFALSLLID